MIIKYSFVTGEVVEIQVESHIAEAAMEIERATHNNNRRETSRHNSSDKIIERGFQFEDKSVDIAAIFEEQQRNEILQNELKKLLPNQRSLVQKIFFQGLSITQIAQAESVCESAIRNRLNKIYKKLRNSQYLGVRI
jgi:DNA-directed RNA polymerase specialized sigma24 family protein